MMNFIYGIIMKFESGIRRIGVCDMRLFVLIKNYGLL